ncbi:hypothetical protein KM043_011135 [Ampulex compressa]|nr:hypothetical protein KM043_011135 [Ampulex compressa]
MLTYIPCPEAPGPGLYGISGAPGGLAVLDISRRTHLRSLSARVRPPLARRSRGAPGVLEQKFPRKIGQRSRAGSARNCSSANGGGARGTRPAASGLAENGPRHAITPFPSGHGGAASSNLQDVAVSFARQLSLVLSPIDEANEDASAPVFSAWHLPPPKGHGLLDKDALPAPFVYLGRHEMTPRRFVLVQDFPRCEGFSTLWKLSLAQRGG